MVYNTLGKKRLYFDGAMGTMLQKKGMKLGEIPELYNRTHPELIEAIHREYLENGSNFITTNTFGANQYKMEKSEYTVEEIITQAIQIAKRAKEGFKDTYIALDIGPSGKVLEPIGQTAFEEVYEVFKEQVIVGDKVGCDVVLFETFTDLYELKAAVLAAKENTSLPIFCTMSFEENGRTFFGTSLESMVMTLEGLGVAALGINCSLGPVQLIPIVKKLMTLAHIPVMVQPNAGLPVMNGNEVRYDITADEFAKVMKSFTEEGVSILGGCCGTTPLYINKLITRSKEVSYKMACNPKRAGICSPGIAVYFDDVTIIGERLNPTGKKALQAALRNEDMDFVIKEAVRQEDQGAHLLDVNMGMPDMDEVILLTKAVKEVQSVVSIPLQIDSSNIEALEAAVRVYNGKPLINSVNGKKESLEAILPIAKKYGAAVLGLTLDEKGIPDTAEARLEIARKIVEEAKKIGLAEEDIFIDTLVVTASAQQSLVKETLKAVRLIKEELGVKTVLGISNVSFGLPERPIINKNMLTAALMQGLDAAIMNPGDIGMQESIAAFRVLMGYDEDARSYIEKFSNQQTREVKIEGKNKEVDIKVAIYKGLKDEVREATSILLESKKPLEIIEEYIVPALDEVGRGYEDKILFLPQLIKSAESAKVSFEILKKAMDSKEIDKGFKKAKVILATVYGDIHDIGKNIVKVIMENYNFEVIDLGKDVSKEEIIEAVIKRDVKIVGLSALMTTTVSSMKETILALKEVRPEVKVIVGGAVLTEELASYVGADYYAKDAMDTVNIASHLKL